MTAAEARQQQADAVAKRRPKTLTISLGGSVTMGLVLIPAGRFRMGGPPDEKHRSRDEGPLREVTMTPPPFYMGVYEVTQAQYEHVMRENPSFYKGPRKPVGGVSWLKAVEFCKRASQRADRTVRLPTEAEWEYACRAGTLTPFNTGETLTAAEANFNDNFHYKGNTFICNSPTRKIMPVGSFAPNAWGLYDMHGNMGEWCSDRYAKSYDESETVNPDGPTSGHTQLRDGPFNIWDTRGFRVQRGGSWESMPWVCRSACRIPNTLEKAYSGYGFRVVVPGMIYAE